MSGKEKIPLKEYLSIYSKVPRLCVDLVVKSGEGILLTKRSIKPDKEMWHFPGGGVFLNESLEDAVKRIAKEELNLEVSIRKILGAIDFFRDFEDYPKHSTSIVFLVESKSENIGINHQSNGVGFFNRPPSPMIPEHKNFMKKLFSL